MKELPSFDNEDKWWSICERFYDAQVNKILRRSSHWCDSSLGEVSKTGEHKDTIQKGVWFMLLKNKIKKQKTNKKKLK